MRPRIRRGTHLAPSTPVTLRITIDEAAGIQVVRLAGWLEGEAVAELDRVVSGTPLPIRLDLTELQSADQAGMNLLKALHARDVPFAGASPFIRLLLGTDKGGNR